LSERSGGSQRNIVKSSWDLTNELTAEKGAEGEEKGLKWAEGREKSDQASRTRGAFMQGGSGGEKRVRERQ